MTVPQMLSSATDHHRAGRLPEAERLYRAILAEQPNHADALHLLGVLATQTGHPQDALQWINKAIAQRPTAEYYFNVANALMQLNQLEQAVAALRQAVALKPTWAGAVGNLGTVLQTTGRLDEAIGCFQRAIVLDPANAIWQYNLGNALMLGGKHAEAVAAFTTAVRYQPNHAAALNNLGSSLHTLGRFAEAAEKLREALRIEPRSAQTLNNLGNTLLSLGQAQEAVEILYKSLTFDSKLPMAHNNLGNAFCALGRYPEGIAAYRNSIALNPGWPEALNNLSMALRSSGDFDGSIGAAEEALRVRPDDCMAKENVARGLQCKGELDRAVEVLSGVAGEHPHSGRVLNSFGNALRGVGRLEEALDCYRRSAENDAGNFLPASNYLFTSQFHVDDPDVLLAAHRQWDRDYAEALKSQIRAFEIKRDPKRRLRIGYVSPDFRTHCQSLFTLALFPHHDRERFEIFCYSTSLETDVVTERLRRHVNVWREIATVTDAAAAELIRADGIDILIDLAMHMAQCRPLIFARKPAPIQACWLAYPGTTGLAAMDYRLTDPYLDPAGFEDRYTEESIRLPDTFWCYEPRSMSVDAAEVLPEPGELPGLQNGFVTFGCLNEFSKVNAKTLLRWGQLMQRVLKSRLHLLAPRGKCREWVREQLGAVGIQGDRVEFIDRQARPAYLAEYGRIDLCLDTLPYNGHTTSLDAFWMGVPVLTQIGRTVVGRAGFSQLTNLGLADFCAETDEQFIALGIRWASDLPGLSQLRQTLRERMIASPLMDGPRFARAMEGAFERMWKLSRDQRG